jgi:putative ABC transport system permease protein
MGRGNVISIVQSACRSRAGVSRSTPFANSAHETRTETEEAFQLGFISMLGNIQFAVNLIGFAVVVAIILVAMNTMMMAARERTAEVAIMKILGFTDGAVV